MSPPAGRILLDECVPRRFQRELAGLEVSHVVTEGWAGQRNGELLRRMRQGGSTSLVTVDRNLAFQQHVAASGVAVIVLHACSNRVAYPVPAEASPRRGARPNCARAGHALGCLTTA